MERLVSSLAKINFHPNCEDILVEKRAANMATSWVTASNLNSTEDSDADSELNSSSDSTKAHDGHEDALDGGAGVGDSSDSDCSGMSGARFSQRRNLPRRACKENSTLKLKRRSIMKPKRNVSRSVDFSMLRPADIKKIYTNKKLTNFRPTNLETIFEEPHTQPDAAHTTADSSYRLIGSRKIRRSLSCSDGLNVNKTLTKQRRAKIKKVFGRRGNFKKISLTDFLERLNKSLEADGGTNAGAVSARAEPMEAEMMNVIEATTSADAVQHKAIKLNVQEGGCGAAMKLQQLRDGVDMNYKYNYISYGATAAPAATATTTVAASAAAAVAASFPVSSTQSSFMGGLTFS